MKSEESYYYLYSELIHSDRVEYRRALAESFSFTLPPRTNHKLSYRNPSINQPATTGTLR